MENSLKHALGIFIFLKIVYELSMHAPMYLYQDCTGFRIWCHGFWLSRQMDCAGFWNKIKSKTFWYLGLYWICGFDSDYSGQSLFKFLGLYWFSESLPTSSKILFVIRVFSNSLDCIGLVNLYRRFSNSLDCIGLVNLYRRFPKFCLSSESFQIPWIVLV